LERMGPAPEIQIIRKGTGKVSRGLPVETVNLRQPPRIGNVQRAEKNVVERAEDGGVRANSERQRNDCRGGVPRCPAQRAKRIPRVLNQSIQPATPAALVKPLARGG